MLGYKIGLLVCTTVDKSRVTSLSLRRALTLTPCPSLRCIPSICYFTCHEVEHSWWLGNVLKAGHGGWFWGNKLRMSLRWHPQLQHLWLYSQSFWIWHWGKPGLQVQIPPEAALCLGEKENSRTISSCIWSKGSFSSEISGTSLINWYDVSR